MTSADGFARGVRTLEILHDILASRPGAHSDIDLGYPLQGEAGLGQGREGQPGGGTAHVTVSHFRANGLPGFQLTIQGDSPRQGEQGPHGLPASVVLGVWRGVDREACFTRNQSGLLEENAKNWAIHNFICENLTILVLSQSS